MTDILIPFILLLGVLVFIHELGHFLAAKWFGVKVERFAIGFGPALASRQIGETEYSIGLLPLGGYVKMLGELPGEELSEDDRARAVNLKPVWQRNLIYFAGPAMNAVLPVFLVAAMLMSGFPTLTARVGAIQPGSLAERVGLEPGDHIVGVNGEALWRWGELIAALRGADEAVVVLEVERGEERLQLTAERETRMDGSFGLLGIEPSRPAAMVGVPDPLSPAAISGVRTGDQIVAVGDLEIGDRYELERALEVAGGQIELEIRRPLGSETETLRLTLDSRDSGASDFAGLGFIPVDFVVAHVAPASPARRADVREGDLLLRVNDRPVLSYSQFRDTVGGSGGEAVQLVLLRGGEPVHLEIKPVFQPVEGEGGTLENRWIVGLAAAPVRVGGEYRTDVVRNPLVALWRGGEQAVEITTRILSGIGQLVTGRVGLENLAGPIGIGEIAADTYASGWMDFFFLMAVISVNLAILNLLPVPVLDGGQILLATAESIRGGPLPAKAHEITQTIGVTFIVLLMGFAFWNDISRNWETIFGFLKGLV